MNPCIFLLLLYHASMKIWFFGTPELAQKVLADLINDDRFKVAFVVTNPDKPIGRSSIPCPSPVKKLANMHNITALQPEKITWNEQLLNHICSFHCDYFVVVAYGKILPKSILEAPKNMCLNVHGSLLPKYRWASPIQSALLQGEDETGVTIMRMNERMDEGDIILTQKIPIKKTDTSKTLFEVFEKISGKALISAIEWLENWNLKPIPQNHTDATYCKKITKEDGTIDWKKSATEIYAMWQAYTPWPWIYTYYNQKRLLLEGVDFQYHDTKHTTVWKVIRTKDGKIGIICGQWILTLHQVKLEWKRSQSIQDFINGNQNFISSHL